MTSIPIYSLYGETVQTEWNPALHVESISLRSGAYDWEIAAHRHEGLLQILYLQRGTGQARLDGRCLRAVSPCIIVVPGQIVHGFTWDGAVEGQVITALQHPLESAASALSPTLASRLLQPRVIAMPNWADADNPLLSLFASLREEYHSRAQDHVACSMGLLLGLLVQVVRYEPVQQTPGADLPSRRSHQMTHFRELVDMHFRQHLVLSDYARALGVTVTTLGRMCQEQLGVTPMTLIHSRIVLEAKRELAYSGLSIKQIAHGLGFNDLAYFSRFFRKHAAMAPGDYRERQRALNQAIASP
jgi:AraC family transcriptional activator of pobA